MEEDGREREEAKMEEGDRTNGEEVRPGLRFQQVVIVNLMEPDTRSHKGLLILILAFVFFLFHSLTKTLKSHLHHLLPRQR